MSKDTYYANLNTRFDKRAEQLHQLGFRYTIVPEWNVALFSRPRIGFATPTTIQASFVMHAGDIPWGDSLRSVG